MLMTIETCHHSLWKCFITSVSSMECLHNNRDFMSKPRCALSSGWSSSLLGTSESHKQPWTSYCNSDKFCIMPCEDLQICFTRRLTAVLCKYYNTCWNPVTGTYWWEISPEGISNGYDLHFTVCGGDIDLLAGRNCRCRSRFDHNHVLIQDTWLITWKLSWINANIRATMHWSLLVYIKYSWFRSQLWILTVQFYNSCKMCL